MNETVVPNEIARQLGVTGLQLRNWLRSQQAAGHHLLTGHLHGQHWKFSRSEADQLIAEYQASGPRGLNKQRRLGQVPSAFDRTNQGARSDAGDSATDPLSRHILSDDPGHRVTEIWMSDKVTTLADLLGTNPLRGVVIGINPSPASVAAGHYYQGRLGQRFFAGLAEAGVLPPGHGFEDDRAFAAGLGFTDLAKRPTARASELPNEELLRGRSLLEERLRALEIPRMIFTFKKSAAVLIGRFNGFGLINRRLFGAEVFVMSGPMAPTAHREQAVSELRDWWQA